jgi:hypothetical protein
MRTLRVHDREPRRESPRVIVIFRAAGQQGRKGRTVSCDTKRSEEARSAQANSSSMTSFWAPFTLTPKLGTLQSKKRLRIV